MDSRCVFQINSRNGVCLYCKPSSVMALGVYWKKKKKHKPLISPSPYCPLYSQRLSHTLFLQTWYGFNSVFLRRNLSFLWACFPPLPLRSFSALCLHLSQLTVPPPSNSLHAVVHPLATTPSVHTGSINKATSAGDLQRPCLKLSVFFESIQSATRTVQVYDTAPFIETRSRKPIMPCCSRVFLGRAIRRSFTDYRNV